MNVTDFLMLLAWVFCSVFVIRFAIDRLRRIRVVHYRDGIGIHGKRYGVNITNHWRFIRLNKWWFLIGPFEFMRFNGESWLK